MTKIRCRCCDKYKDASEMTDIKHWSVDFDFCMKAKKAGFKIFVDPDAAIDHMGDSEIVNTQTFFKHNKQFFDKLNKK